MADNWSLFYKLTRNNGVWNIYYNTSLIDCLHHIFTYAYNDVWYVVKDFKTEHIELFDNSEPNDIFDMANTTTFSFNRNRLENPYGDVVVNYDKYNPQMTKYICDKLTEYGCSLFNLNVFISEMERKEGQTYENNKNTQKEKIQYEDSKSLKQLKRYKQMLRTIDNITEQLKAL